MASAIADVVQTMFGIILNYFFSGKRKCESARQGQSGCVLVLTLTMLDVTTMMSIKAGVEVTRYALDVGYMSRQYKLKSVELRQ